MTDLEVCRHLLVLLFHEIKHVLQQKLRKHLFIMSRRMDKQMEDDADVFAQDTLIPPEEI